MLAEKPWKLEAVLHLILTIFVSLFAGALLGSAVAQTGDKGWLPATVDRKFLTFVITVLSFQGAVLIGLVHFLRAQSISWHTAFGFSKPNPLAAAGWGLLAIVLALPVAFLLAKVSTEILSRFGLVARQQAAVEMLQTAKPVGQTIVYGFFAVLLAPVAEELMFRGVLYPTIKQCGFPRLALWGTSLLFAAIHVNLMAFLPLTFLALVLVALYEKTENLIAPIVTHVLFNAVNFYLIVAPAKWKPGWFVQ